MDDITLNDIRELETDFDFSICEDNDEYRVEVFDGGPGGAVITVRHPTLAIALAATVRAFQQLAE